MTPLPWPEPWYTKYDADAHMPESAYVIKGVAAFDKLEDVDFAFRAVHAHDSLVSACKDAEAALEWEDPYGDTDITKEDRVAESLKIIRAALAKASER